MELISELYFNKTFNKRLYFFRQLAEAKVSLFPRLVWSIEL